MNNVSQKDLLNEVMETSYDLLMSKNPKMNEIISFMANSIKKEAASSLSYTKVFIIVTDGQMIPNKSCINCTPENKDSILKAIMTYFIDAHFDVDYNDPNLIISWKNQFSTYLEGKLNVNSLKNGEKPIETKNKSPKRSRKPQVSYENKFKNEFPGIYDKWKLGKTTTEKAAKRLDIGISTFHRWAKEYEKQLALTK